MRKTVTILMFLLVSVAAYAQNCTFKVKFTVTPASCYNNGKVAYALFDTNGNVVANAAALAALGLEQVRIYYKENEGDTTKFGNFYRGGWDTLMVDYGRYIVGVEGLCGYNHLDTNTVLNVPTTYQIPVMSSFGNVATSTTGRNSLGMRPTLACINTGVVPFKIKGGSFPFKITVKNQDNGSSLKTVVFDTNQYFGNDSSNYNYKHYYSIERLPAGNWTFQLEDGCGYITPIHSKTVTTLETPKFKSATGSLLRVADVMSMYANNNNDYQVVSAMVNIDDSAANYQRSLYWYNYYHLHEVVQYRFNYGGGQYSTWRPFPEQPEFQSSSSNIILLSDTLRTNICNLFGKKVTIEYRDLCTNETYTDQFELYDPRKYVENRYSGLEERNEGCVTYQQNHTSHYYISLLNYRAYTAGSSTVYAYIAYEPFNDLEWVYTDLNTGTIIKRDTVGNKYNTYFYGTTYPYNSYLRDTEVEQIYGSFETNPLVLNIKRELTSKACGSLISDTVVMEFKYNKSSGVPYWTYNYNYNSPYYCGSERWTHVYSHGYIPSSLDLDVNDSTIVRLIRSPYNDRYNFEGVWDMRTKSWRSLNRDNLTTANITVGGNGTSFQIRDFNLPSGPYHWQVITPCDTYNIQYNAYFPELYELFWQPERKYELTGDCTKGQITYTAGKLGFHKSGQNPSGIDTLYPDYVPAATCFRIINGPTGGYNTSEGRYYRVGEPMEVTMAGRYIVAVYYSDFTGTGPIYSAYRDIFCKPIYDTIDFNLLKTVEFDYAIALLCTPTSTSGNVYVKAKSGTAPYTYTLYSRADLQGTVLGSNTTGRFYNIPYKSTDRLSCKVVDQCGAEFKIDITPKVWTELQKVWFDNNLTQQTSCEGDSICVNALVLGDILNYLWSGPDGFSSTNSEECLFLPRGATPGSYTVHIYSSGCSPDYVEAIRLDIDKAPSVKLGSDMNVCQGEPTELTFIPQSYNTTDPVSFTVVFEDLFNKTTQSFSTASGDTARYTISPTSDTKVYVSVIDDGSCEYTYADDTMYVRIKPIPNYTVSSTDDLVCYEGDATLTASSSLARPYIIRWYNDYALTDLAKADTITAAGAKSTLNLPGLTEDKTLWISVERDNVCPTIYGIPNRIANMTDGATTTLSLGQTYRFYDAGGLNGNHTPITGTTTHTFKSNDGKPITIKFDYKYMYYSNMYIFSGTSVNQDSLLAEINQSSTIPVTVTSRGDALTIHFVSNYANNNWTAIVEHEPAMAVAKVRKVNSITLYDTVCQSQTNNYIDRNRIVPSVASQDTLNKSMRKYGVYTFTKTFTSSDATGCDSTVTFNLMVTKPSSYDTTVVISNMTHPNGYLWNGTRYKEAGEYYKYTTLTGGCDSVDILNLVVIKIETLDKEICLGDTTDLTINATVEGAAGGGSSYNTKVYVGDVLCTDGTTMNVEDFVSSGKTALGVVTHVDAAGGFGRAIALSGTENSVVRRWCGSGYTYINSLTQTNLIAIAGADMKGPENTANIVAGARNQGTLTLAAAYHCMYYDPSTFTTGTDSLGWYMPSAGEMQLVYANRVALNKTLTQLNTTNSSITPLQAGTYWTSTEYNDPGFDYAWTIQEGLIVGKDKYGNYYVRPMIRFTLP